MLVDRDEPMDVLVVHANGGGLNRGSGVDGERRCAHDLADSHAPLAMASAAIRHASAQM